MNPLSSRRICSLFFILASFTLIPLTTQSAQAQSSPPTHKAPPPPAPPPAVDQQQFISYWTTEIGWRTELQLRNNQVGHILTVTPVLRTADGTETPLFPVVVQPQEVKTVDVATAIGTSTPQLIGTYGSLALRYSAPSQINLYAVSMVMGVGHSIAFHIDATGEDKAENVGGREGIWWLPNGTANDYLVLMNQGQNPLPLGLSLFDSSGKASTQNLTLPPRGMNRLSVRQLVLAAKLAGSYGGIKISAANHAGSLDTLHVLFDQEAGFSAVMKMFFYDPRDQLKERDYAKTGQWTLRAPMFALSNADPSLAFPVGTVLQPQLFIRNTTSKPIDASLTFNWRSDIASGKSPASALHLNPNETRRIDVAALQDGKTLPQNAQWASVTLATTGLPGEVVAAAASYDQFLHHGAQTPFSDQLAAHWVGGQWHYDPQHDSIITAGNGGSKPTQAAFTIFYNQGTQKYQLEQTLQPGEQMWMDIGKLIRENVPDKNGITLPADLTTGSYEVRDLTNKGVGTLFEGKVIYDKTYGHVTYGCAACCGWTTPVVPWYDPISIIITTLQDDGVDAWYPCENQYDDVSTSFYNNWGSSDTSVVTVDYYGTHNGVAVGSTTSDTFGILQSNDAHINCPTHGFTPSGSANVMSFTGVLTASDNFSGRSTTRFGIGETIQLSYTASPTGTTAASLGGLQWSIVSGGGSLSGAGTDGNGTYTSPGNQATAVLRLAVVSGSSQGQHHDYSISIITPNGGLESKFSNLRHTQGFEGVGFQAYIFLEPTDVSFANLEFAEGTTNAIASGFFAPDNGQVHPPTDPPVAIGLCDSVIGCQVMVADEVDSGDHPPPFSVGGFLWQIPWQYKTSTGSLTAFTTANHHETADATGKGTIEKAGAGPFSKNASDPTSSY